MRATFGVTSVVTVAAAARDATRQPPPDRRARRDVARRKRPRLRARDAAVDVAVPPVMAWHVMACHGMAWHGMARHGTARKCNGKGWSQVTAAVASVGFDGGR